MRRPPKSDEVRLPPDVGKVISLREQIRSAYSTSENRLQAQTDIRRPQVIAHEVIEAPGKVVIHVRPSIQNHYNVSDHNM